MKKFVPALALVVFINTLIILDSHQECSVGEHESKFTNPRLFTTELNNNPCTLNNS